LILLSSASPVVEFSYPDSFVDECRPQCNNEAKNINRGQYASSLDKTLVVVNKKRSAQSHSQPILRWSCTNAVPFHFLNAKMTQMPRTKSGLSVNLSRMPPALRVLLIKVAGFDELVLWRAQVEPRARDKVLHE